MSYTVLARKYRPQCFRDVIGQEHVTRTLTNALTQGRIAHGYIFSGHRGIGKTTVARILAMALNCRAAEHPAAEPCGVCDSCVEVREGRSVDVIEIDAATNRGIDEIRELREAARYRPARDRYKIYILDEAHQITDAAFNALLKTLEEPPGHIIFMMATTQPEDIPQTIRSRCQHFSFHAVKFDEIVGQLRVIAEQECIQADDDALAMLAEAGDGSMRDALSIMDQAIACCGERLTGETVRQLVGAVPSEILEHMMMAVQANSSESVLRLVDKLVTEGHSPVHFARQMVRFLRNTLVAKVAGGNSPLLQISSDERARVTRIAELFSEEDLARFLQILLRTHSELGYKQDQRFYLELGLLKLVHAQRLLPIEQLLSGADLRPIPRSATSASPARGPAAAQPRTLGAAPRTAASPLTADVHSGTPQPGVLGTPAQKHTARSGISTGSPPSAPKPGAPGTPSQRSGSGSSGASAASTGGTSAAVAPAADLPLTESDVRDRVLTAAESAGYHDLANMLRQGEWKFDSGEIGVQVPDAPVLVQMAFKKEAEQELNAAATAALGRPTRLKIIANAKGGVTPAAPAAATGSATHRRVADEPVIRRLQEKFGAEIRSVIDYREKD